MTPLADIEITGKAPNDTQNATTDDALSMEQYFTTLFRGTTAKVLGLFINTTVRGANNAQMIDFTEVVPTPELTARFFYHLQVSSPTLGEQYWAVSSWVSAVKFNGLEAATREKMLLANPEFTYLSFEPTYEAIKITLEELYSAE